MSFLKKLSALFSGGPGSSGEANALYYYVRCRRCGEIVKGRINLANDLSAEYDDNDRTTGYVFRKALIGRGRCFQAMEVSMGFDAQRRVTSQEVTGGEFVSEEDYEAAQGADKT